eukprot:scaffold594938_cov19-Prasinocladus_malaysianus.AAC.1
MESQSAAEASLLLSSLDQWTNSHYPCAISNLGRRITLGVVKVARYLDCRLKLLKAGEAV